MSKTKQLSKQLAIEAQLGHFKSKVHSSRSKMMILVIFDLQCAIYTNHVPKRTIVNATYFRTALCRFVKVLG
jgi:hypothetical protein